MTGFWVTAGILSLIAVAFLAVPMLAERRRSGRKSIVGPLVAVAVVPVSLALYLNATTFDPEADMTAVAQDEMQLLDQLAARLSEDPSDVNGWILLGRSYIQLGDYARARIALEQAWNRTEEPDDLLKLAYAQTLLFTEPGAALSLAGDLVEEVLAGSPGNENALLWGGFVAAERNQPDLAADRWMALLAANPPPAIADIVREQIGLLTGSAIEATEVAEPAGPVVEVNVTVADSVALESLGATALLFVIASAEDSPAPVAVERHPLAALPGTFSLSDADAMIPARRISLYDEVTIVARISLSGEPTAQSGDIFAEAIVDPRAGEPVNLVIDRIVP